MNTTYNINFSDVSITGKTTLQLLPNQMDDTSTSLVLHGYGSLQYGEHLWENMVHLMEHFCSRNVEPNKPTEGQLWYNAANKSLNLRTLNSEGVPAWVNIIPNYGFDATSGTLADDSVPTISTIKNVLLKDYVKTSDGDFTLSGVLTLNDTQSNYSLVGGSYVPNATNTTNRFNAASRFYVDNKVNQIVATAITAITPSSLPGVTAKSVSDVLKKANDPSLIPYLSRSGDLGFRTMTDSLILRSMTKDTANINDDEAISKKYLDSRLTGSNNMVSATSVTTAINTAVTTSTTNPTNLVSKFGDTIAGDLILPVINDDTPNQAAVSKLWVTDLVNKVTPSTVISSTENVSYTQLPDLTKMVYGLGRGKITQSVTTGANANNAPTNKTWFNANIVFPSGVSFTNRYYSVTVTEDVPLHGTETAAPYPKTRTLYDSTGSSALTNQTSWPLSFSVYNKTENGFSVCVFSPSGIDIAYAPKTLSFNFIAIGR